MSLLCLLEESRTSGLTLPDADRIPLMVLKSFAYSLACVVTPSSASAGGVCVLLEDSLRSAGYGYRELERPLRLFLTSLVQDYVVGNAVNPARIQNLRHALRSCEDAGIQRAVGLVAYCCTDYFEQTQYDITTFLNYPIPGGRAAYHSGARWLGVQMVYRKELAATLARAIRQYVNGQNIKTNGVNNERN